MRLPLVLFLLGSLSVTAVLGDDKCNANCTNNNDCVYTDPPTNVTNLCTACSSEKKCVAGAACGANCSVDTDCNQAGLCRLCRTDGYSAQGICSSPRMCGDYCDASQPCQGQCTVCQNNMCHAACNGPCFNRTAARRGTRTQTNQCASECPLCLQTGKCGANLCCTNTYCHANCSADADCGGDCPACSPSLHRCVTRGCGSPCAVNGDCTHTGGHCLTCYAGFCTSNCGGTCALSSECNADCNVCLNSKCGAGGCGARCLSNAGCDATSPCSRCYAPLHKCIEGLKCGEECINDLDCDQSPASTCRICPLQPNVTRGICTST